MTSNKKELLATGLAGLDAGLSLIPINRLSKQPLWRMLPYLYDEDGSPTMKEGKNKELFHARGWTPFMSERATPAELTRWINGGAQLGVVGGQVSGGLLVIDFDKPGYFFRWLRIVQRNFVDIEHLVIQRTGGGGWQVLIRCDAPGVNDKLAEIKDDTQDSGWSTAIETRGERGYALIAPSLHPSGNCYKWRRGDLVGISRYCQFDADFMLSATRMFNEKPKPTKVEHVSRGTSSTVLRDGEGVIDRYNAITDIHDELARFGHTDAGGRWHRPGFKQNGQPSVVFGKDEHENQSYHHSANDPLHDGFWKTPFAVRLFYEFSGDLKEAVKTIAAELGMQYTPTPRPSKLAWDALRASTNPMRGV